MAATENGMKFLREKRRGTIDENCLWHDRKMSGAAALHAELPLKCVKLPDTMAAVDQNVGTGDKGGKVAEKEGNQTSDLVHCAKTLHGSIFCDFVQIGLRDIVVNARGAYSRD